MKSATISDLIFFKALLMLDIYLLDNTVNLAELNWFMRTNTYLQNGPLEVILILGLSFLLDFDNFFDI